MQGYIDLKNMDEYVVGQRKKTLMCSGSLEQCYRGKMIFFAKYVFYG